MLKTTHPTSKTKTNVQQRFTTTKIKQKEQHLSETHSEEALNIAYLSDQNLQRISDTQKQRLELYHEMKARNERHPPL